MILPRIRIIVGDAGFEPGTFASEVWCATNEPPHLLKFAPINLDPDPRLSQNYKINYEKIMNVCLKYSL